MGEHADKRTRLNTKSFLGGQQSEPDHIITAIANFDALTMLAADYPDHDSVEQPLVVRQMGKLANLFSSADFTRFTQKYKSESHLSHSMLVQVQMIFAQFARIATNTKLQNQVTMGHEVSRDAYNDAIEQFEDVIRNIKQVLHSSTLGIYKQVPRSYEPPVRQESQPSRKRAGDARKKDDGDDKRQRNNDKAKESGWLVVTSGFLKFPQTIKKTPCIGYARVGRYCKFNPCKFSHDQFPDGYERADQKVICHFIDNADNAKFAQCVPVDKLAAARAVQANEPSPATVVNTEAAAAN